MSQFRSHIVQSSNFPIDTRTAPFRAFSFIPASVVLMLTIIFSSMNLFAGTWSGNLVENSWLDVEPGILNPACVSVSMPAGLTGIRNSVVTVPVTTSDLTGLGVISFDINIAYNPSVVTEVSVDSAGTLSNGMTITVNNSTPGTLIISAFSANPLPGSGTLIKINFFTTGAIGSSSAVVFNSFSYNEGNPCSTTSNGDITIVSAAITGRVSYANSFSFKPVPNTLLSAAGSINSSTNSAFVTGTYGVRALGPGSYLVTPSKTSDVTSITGFDAALIAKQVVALLTLNPTQAIAADVSANGTVTSFDAALIAQYIVLTPNPGITGTWIFSPADRSYSNVEANQPNQDYSAILMGEVSGDWTPPSSRPNEELPLDAPQVTVNVTAPNVNELIGTNFSMPVTVSDTTGDGIIAFQFDLLYDPSVITPQANPIDTVGTISDGMSVTYNVPSPGLLKVVFFSATPRSGSGTLFKFKFT